MHLLFEHLFYFILPVSVYLLKHSSKLYKYLTLQVFVLLRFLLFALGPGSSASMNKSSTLPLPHRLSMERPASSAGSRDRDRDRDGYYSDRNELIRERERERDRGYLSDHNSSR